MNVFDCLSLLPVAVSARFIVPGGHRRSTRTIHTCFGSTIPFYGTRIQILTSEKCFNEYFSGKLDNYF